MTHRASSASTTILCVVLAGCGSSKTDSPQTNQLTETGTETEGAAYVKFATPTAGAKLHGLSNLQLSTNIANHPAELTLALDDAPLVKFENIATSIQLDTTRFKDGTRKLHLTATTAEGDVYTDDIQVEFDNPTHRFLSSTSDKRAYGRGEVMVMQLHYSEPGLQLKPDFSVLDSAFSPANVKVTDLGGGRYEVRYTISATNTKESRLYEVPITSTGSDAPALVSYVTVDFLGAPQIPLRVSAPNAILSDRSIPLLTSATGPKLEVVDAPKTLIEGQPQSMTVRWTASEADPVDRIVLSSAGSSGTWVIPLAAPSSSGEMTIPIQAAGSPSELTKTNIPVSAAAVGGSGTTGGSTMNEMDIITMNLFGIKFLLNWSTGADLDLEITTPDGSKINFENPKAQNGILERDANSTCTNIQQFPLESISWASKDMVPGSYGIRVSQYDSCDASDTYYSVTILACGKAQTLQGSFTKTVDMATQEKIFDPYVVDCIHRVHGRITYEKETFSGLQNPPAVEMPVQLTGTGLPGTMSTTTNENGEYSFIITTNGVNNAKVRTQASWSPPGATTLSAQVWPLTGTTVYEASEDVGALSSLDVEKNISITRDKNSGAFNIVDVMRRAVIWKNSFFEGWVADKVKPLVARWTKGLGTPDAHGGNTGGSFYWCRTDNSSCGIENKAIWLGGDPTNPSEFADTVIAHEFSHHIQSSLDITTPLQPKPDGTFDSSHGFSQLIAPYFAWSEGSATGMGQVITRSPIYRNGNPVAGGIVDVEATPKPAGDLTQGAAMGTSPANDASGLINEFLVASIFYDLMDPANEPGNDEIAETPYATAMTLSRYLKTPKMTDRMGFGVDLVEFLDGWRCYQTYAAQYYHQTYSDTPLDTLVKFSAYAYAAPTTPPTCP
jgi:hypothetical protein